MKQKILFLLLLFIGLSHVIYAQEGKPTHKIKLIAGASVSHWQYADKDKGYRYHETTSNVNVATPINRNIYLGLSYLYINTISKGLSIEKNKERNHYFMAGLFAQYDFLPEQKDRLLAEISYHYGNYCSCGNNSPFFSYRSTSLSYFGFGGSYDWHLTKGLFLDIGFNVHTILNKRDQKDIFALYVLGINYHFPLVSKLNN